MSLELRIGNLSKTYPNGVKALQNVSLTIPAGMFGLLGSNGAGKSTLMRTLATLQEPDEGTIHLGDLDVVRQKDAVRETLTCRRTSASLATSRRRNSSSTSPCSKGSATAASAATSSRRC
jgi:ABC-type multidrug transport system ATPase subunit